MRRLAFQYVSICLSYQKKAISNFQWERMFANMNINEMAYFKLSKMFCVRVIQQTNDAYKYYIKNKNNDHLFEDLQVLKT